MKSQAFNAETDHTPFWRAVDPYVAKSEESTRWRLPAETAAQHDHWVREHGEVPALMLYYRYLAPKLMEDGQRLDKSEDLNKMAVSARAQKYSRYWQGSQSHYNREQFHNEMMLPKHEQDRQQKTTEIGQRQAIAQLAGSGPVREQEEEP